MNETDRIPSKGLTLSIVIPVYNEEEAIPQTYRRLIRLRNDARLVEFSEIELVFVDDGSTDSTPVILRHTSRVQQPEGVTVRPLYFSRNFGHSSAVLAGLDAARGDMVAIIDADLQDPPELIPAMCAQIRGGWDVVYGQRTARIGESWWKRFTAWCFYRILCFVSGMRFPKDTGDFRVITREVCDAVKMCNETEPFLRGLIPWLGFRQVAFPYIREAREFGTTKYPFRKMLRFASLALVNFSSLPLRLALYFGVLGFVLFAALSGWALLIKIKGDAVPGWTSLLIGVTWGQSILLIMIGILGVYVGRVHSEVRGRPRYILRSCPSNP